LRSVSPVSCCLILHRDHWPPLASCSLLEDGDEVATELAAAPHPFDAIVLDISMTRSDGADVCRSLRDDRSVKCPIIAMTAATSTEDVQVRRVWTAPVCSCVEEHCCCRVLDTDVLLVRTSLQRYYTMGFDVVLPKPFSRESLGRALVEGRMRRGGNARFARLPARIGRTDSSNKDSSSGSTARTPAPPKDSLLSIAEASVPPQIRHGEPDDDIQITRAAVEDSSVRAFPVGSSQAAATDAPPAVSPRRATAPAQWALPVDALQVSRSASAHRALSPARYVSSVDRSTLPPGMFNGSLSLAPINE
jgi:CheY-like chemotaxis protein